MNGLKQTGLLCGLMGAVICLICLFSRPAKADKSEAAAWVTNGFAVFSVETSAPKNVAANLPASTPSSGGSSSNLVFHGYVPGSLNHVIWTNFVAHTNGREMTVWATRSHSADWPKHPPIVTWNRKSLLWGMKGMTALSPCWEGEGAAGQVPVTALTRRHVYARGHGMGPEGFNENFAGKKIWFVTTNDRVVEATVLRNVVRLYKTKPADYTIMLLSQDLPVEIEPMGVVSQTVMYTKYPETRNAPRPLFQTEQRGEVSAGVEGWRVNTWKGGDSGSPDMLPMPGELFFIRGRSTSEASMSMQEDMDQLSKSSNLDPKKYQMKWLNLAGYPSVQ